MASLASGNLGVDNHRLSSSVRRARFAVVTRLDRFCKVLLAVSCQPSDLCLAFVLLSFIARHRLPSGALQLR